MNISWMEVVHCWCDSLTNITVLRWQCLLICIAVTFKMVCKGHKVMDIMHRRCGSVTTFHCRKFKRAYDSTGHLKKHSCFILWLALLVRKFCFCKVNTGKFIITAFPHSILTVGCIDPPASCISCLQTANNYCMLCHSSGYWPFSISWTVLLYNAGQLSLNLLISPPTLLSLV